MSVARDLQLTARTRRAGANHAWKIIRTARRAGVPLSWAFALVEQESSFRNVFGHDRGSILHGRAVTRSRVQTLLDHISRGGVSNGVGLTQLTWPPYIRWAERIGGAHKPTNQLRVGFAVLRKVTGGDYARQAWRFNGARSYQAQIAAKQRRWHSIITK